MFFSVRKSGFARPLHSHGVPAALAGGKGISLWSALTRAAPAIIVSAALIIGGASTAIAAELVNINSADVDTIANSITGIGPAKAQAIVDYRQQNGTFMQLEELTNVPGIGDATLAQIKSLITIGDPLSSE